MYILFIFMFKQKLFFLNFVILAVPNKNKSALVKHHIRKQCKFVRIQKFEYVILYLMRANES